MSADKDQVSGNTLLEDAVQERLRGAKASTSGQPHDAAQSKGNDKHTYHTAGTKGKTQPFKHLQLYHLPLATSQMIVLIAHKVMQERLNMTRDIYCALRSTGAISVFIES